MSPKSGSWILLAVLALARLAPCAAADTPAAAGDAPAVHTTLELQVELHRRGFSCGSIDGVEGFQTQAALRAFQRSCGIAETGSLDLATREHLRLSAPALGAYTFTAAELGSLHPIPPTWLGKSEMASLGYATAIEMAGERFHANPKLLRQLNPDVNWDAVLPGTRIVVPAADTVAIEGDAAQIVIGLGARELEVTDSVGHVIAHFPVSIARMAEKRPVGDLHVTVVIPDPDYTFDPELFPESPEGQTLGHKLTIPPGPNNPVGRAWIGLDRPGYGIHGTPEPENVGRTESHGCFRLANWDVLTLAGMVRVGMPVTVDP